MRNYIIKRFLQLIPVLILVSIFSFLIIHAAPGDPIQNYVKPGMSEEQIQTIREEYGVDGNIVKQYVAWVGHVVRGDLGTSIYKNRPVTELLAEKLPATLILMGAALLISLLVSIPLGLWAGLKKNKMTDNIISFLSYFGISVPQFWLAMILIIIFALTLEILPSGGMRYDVGSSSSPGTTGCCT